MAAPPNIVHSPRDARAVARPADGRRCWSSTRGCRASDRTLRWGPCSAGRRRTPLAGTSRADERPTVLPDVGAAVELFRRADADRAGWRTARADPSRLLYVGHATAADGDVGHADRAALHLADDRPLTASDLMSAKLPMPPRVALLACASGGDYQFDEATGLVAAMILGGAQLVTATLWSLPTAAGYRQFASRRWMLDPMASDRRRRPRARGGRRGTRGEQLAARADAPLARRRSDGQPAVLGGAGHLRRRRCAVISGRTRRRRRTRRPER